MRRAAKVDAVVTLRQLGACVGGCPVCGEQMGIGSRGRNRTYCSRECAGKAVGKAGDSRFRNALRSYKCEQCGEPFEAYHKGRKFCSRTCFGIQRQIDGISKMRSFSARVDKNQGEIVDALRSVGASVFDLSRFGRGMPDLIVGFRGKNFLIEVKNPQTSYGRKGLNLIQTRWVDKWNGDVHIAYTIEDALRAIGL